MAPRVALVANTDWYLYNFRLSLAREIRAAGADAVLVSPPGSYVPRFREAGFEWLPIGMDRRGLNPIFEAFTWMRFLLLYQRQRFDLVHHFTHKPVIYGSLAAKALGRMPVVNSVTGAGYLFVHPGWGTAALRRLVLPAFRAALSGPNVRVIFENPDNQAAFVRSGLVRLGGSSIVGGTGVDPEHFRPAPEPSGIPVLLMPARMLWDKGVGDVVEAARILRSRGASVRFVLAGAADEGSLARISERQLRQWQADGLVEWIGHQDDMAALFARAHVVTLASQGGEGLPRSLVEAAACGKPIVATDVDGCREVVRDGVNGFLVPPRNPGALASAIERLIGDPALRQAMGLRGRRIVVERFTDETINDQTLAVYRELIELPAPLERHPDESARSGV